METKSAAPSLLFWPPPKTTSQHVLLPVMVVLVLVLVLVVLVLVVVVVVVVVGGVVVVVAAAGVVVVVVVLVVVTGQLSLCKTSTKNLDHILETNNCSPAPLLFFGAPPQKVLLSLPPPRDKDCSPVVSFWTPPLNNTSKTLKTDQPRLQLNKSNKSTYLRNQQSLKPSTVSLTLSPLSSKVATCDNDVGRLFLFLPTTTTTKHRGNNKAPMKVAAKEERDEIMTNALQLNPHRSPWARQSPKPLEVIAIVPEVVLLCMSMRC